MTFEEKVGQMFFGRCRKSTAVKDLKRYYLGGYPLIISDTKEKATLLKSLGINVNLAPVCDISTNPKDYIYKRTFGKNAAETAKYVKTVVETMSSNNIGATLKHFPGYGKRTLFHFSLELNQGLGAS